MINKFAGYMVAFIVAILIAMVFSSLIFECRNESKYKYRIYYNHGRWSGTDYTDTFEIQNGPSIKYTNDCNQQITRYGTFSIQKVK